MATRSASQPVGTPPPQLSSISTANPALVAESAHRIGLRIICPDRPGIGLSTFDSSRTLLDYPSQIAQLAKHLGLESYRVMGGSGGGPYVLGEQKFHRSIYTVLCSSCRAPT